MSSAARVCVATIVAFAVAACGGSAPTPRATTASPSPPVIALPTMPPPSCPPASRSFELTAKSIRFDKDCLVVPAGESFTIVLHNDDPAVSHNVGIHDQTISQKFFSGIVIIGVATVTYHVPALKKGTYLFHCDIHPNAMNGTLTVEG